MAANILGVRKHSKTIRTSLKPTPGAIVVPPLSLEVDVDTLAHNGHADDEEDERNGGVGGGERHERVSSESGASARLLEQSPRPVSTKFERSKSASFTLPRPPRGDRDRGDRHAAGSPAPSIRWYSSMRGKRLTSNCNWDLIEKGL